MIQKKLPIYLIQLDVLNSNEALRTLRLAREIGGWKLVKLEVLGDKKNLFPDMIETLKSTEILSKEGIQGNGLL